MYTSGSRQGSQFKCFLKGAFSFFRQQRPLIRCRCPNRLSLFPRGQTLRQWRAKRKKKWLPTLMWHPKTSLLSLWCEVSLILGLLPFLCRVWKYSTESPFFFLSIISSPPGWIRCQRVNSFGLCLRVYSVDSINRLIIMWPAVSMVTWQQVTTLGGLGKKLSLPYGANPKSRPLNQDWGQNGSAADPSWDIVPAESQTNPKWSDNLLVAGKRV